MWLYIALQGYALHLQRFVMLVHDLQSMLKLFNRQFLTPNAHQPLYCLAAAVLYGRTLLQA